MTRPPNLRYQDFDKDNVDLDKRYKPKNSCFNCPNLKSGSTRQATCRKHNYITRNIISRNFPICDDHPIRIEEAVANNKWKQKQIQDKKERWNKLSLFGKLKARIKGYW